MNGSGEPEGAPPPGSASTVLEAQAVAKTYRKPGMLRPSIVRAVDHVSVALSRRTTVAIVGESGCGKSTLARLLLSLEQPDSGMVSFQGLPLGTMNRAKG